jgi:hypothetical protein
MSCCISLQIGGVLLFGVLQFGVLQFGVLQFGVLQFGVLQFGVQLFAKSASYPFAKRWSEHRPCQRRRRESAKSLFILLDNH